MGGWVKVPAGADEGDRPADGRQPQRDRVVEQHRGDRVGGRDVVEHQRADQSGIEDPDPAGDREDVGQVADQVGQREHRRGGLDAERGQAAPQHRHVGSEVGRRADQPPARPDQDLLGGRDRARGRPCGGGEPALGAQPVGAVGQDHEQPEDEQPDAGGQRGQKQVVRSGQRAGEEREAGEDEHGDVDGTGQPEQDRRALGDPPDAHPALVEHPAAERDPAGAADRDDRAERHLGPGDAGRRPPRGGVEHEREREHVAQAGHQLQRGGGRDPAGVDVAEPVDSGAQSRNGEHERARDDAEHGREHDPVAQPPPMRVGRGLRRGLGADRRGHAGCSDAGRIGRRGPIGRPPCETVVAPVIAHALSAAGRRGSVGVAHARLASGPTASGSTASGPMASVVGPSGAASVHEASPNAQVERRPSLRCEQDRARLTPAKMPERDPRTPSCSRARRTAALDQRRAPALDEPVARRQNRSPPAAGPSELGERIRGHHPLAKVGGKVQRALSRGQRHVDHRRVEHHHQLGDPDHRQDQPPPLVMRADGVMHQALRLRVGR